MNDARTPARDADSEIDATALDMTQADPGQDFDAGVMERLADRSSPGWRFAGRSVRWVAAAAVLLALGARWTATMSDRAVPAPGAIVVEAPALVSAPALPTARLDDAPARRPAAGPDRAEDATEPELSETEAAWLSRRVTELAIPAPVVIDAIQPTDVAIPLLEVTPLTPARVALRPLGETKPGAVR